MGFVDLPVFEDYFQGDFCICPTVRQAMTLKGLKNWDNIYILMMKNNDLTSKVQILTSCIKQDQL